MDPTKIVLILFFILIIIIGMIIYAYEKGIFSSIISGGEQPPLPPGFQESGSEVKEEQPPAFPG